MFNRLRRNFTLMNMLVLSLMMLISFSVIYFLIYSQTQNEIRRDLLMLSGMPAKNEPHFELQPDITAPDNVTHKGGGYREENRKNPDATQPNHPAAGFTLIIDSQTGEILHSKTFFDMQEIDYESLLKYALEKGNEEGKITESGYHWAYRIDSAPDRPDTKISFLETSAVEQVLSNLIKIFVLVATLLLLVIWLISRNFAKRAVRPVQDAFLRQKEFISDASHELKTPVAVIQTNVDVLASNENETIAAQRKWIDNIRFELARMQALTGKLLYLTKLEDEESRLDMTQLNLSDLVNNCLLPMEAVFYEKQQRFENEVTDDLWVKGNSDELQQVLHILLENANKYTPEGGQIFLRLHRAGKKAALSVSNSGEAISPEDQALIFSRFYRADKSRSRKSGGYGLGLAIAQRIARRHLGTLQVASAPGQLTTFTFTMPLAEYKK